MATELLISHPISIDDIREISIMPKFSHLHVHSQYSLLDEHDISAMFKKATSDGMPGLAMPDHGNMFGVFQFVKEAEKLNKNGETIIKPIVGCEFYVVDQATARNSGEENVTTAATDCCLPKCRGVLEPGQTFFPWAISKDSTANTRVSIRN